MQIRVLYFAVLRESRGCTEEQVDLDPGTTTAQLYQSLFGRPLEVMVAVNQEYATAATELVEGDEVAFIPALGGG